MRSARLARGSGSLMLSGEKVRVAGVEKLRLVGLE